MEHQSAFTFATVYFDKSLMIPEDLPLDFSCWMLLEFGMVDIHCGFRFHLMTFTFHRGFKWVSVSGVFSAIHPYPEYIVL